MSYDKLLRIYAIVLTVLPWLVTFDSFGVPVALILHPHKKLSAPTGGQMT